MADSEIKPTKEIPDTGQKQEESEVSSASDEVGAVGGVSSNPFQGVKPARFIPATGLNPFAARPAFRADGGVSTSASTGTPSPAKFVLRPSALSAQTANLNKFEGITETTSSTSCLLKPAKLPDPTKIVSKEKEVTEKENKAEGSVFSEKDKDPPDSSQDDLFLNAIKEHEKDKEKKQPDSSSSPEDEGLTSSASGDNILGENLTEKVTGVHTSPKGLVSSTGFVFGENLAERVEIKGNNEVDESSIDNGVASPDSTEPSDQNAEAKTLEESAREYQELRSKKPDLQEVELFTGEENESNVLQTNGKLFVFDGETQNWVERGRGVLRLNDMKCLSSQTFQSRLLMRTQGSLRLILNTKVWPGMTVERASPKSVRVTGTDGDSVKVFLLMTNPKDTENILRALDWRIQQLRVQEEKLKELGSVPGTEKRKADNESPTEELTAKKAKKSDDEGVNNFNRREESDSSVVDPETEVSSESHASSLNLRTDSD